MKEAKGFTAQEMAVIYKEKSLNAVYIKRHRIKKKLKGCASPQAVFVIMMDDSNYENMHRLAPSRDYAEKIFRMTEFCRHTDRDHVPDPYYEGQEGFDLVIDMLEDGCREIVAEFKNRIQH